MYLYKELSVTDSKRNNLLVKQNEIITDQFDREKSAMEALITKKSQTIARTLKSITHNENKINTYKQYQMHLKHVNVSLEKNNTGK